MSDYDFLSDIEQLDDSSSENDENTNEQSAMYDGAMNELAKLMMLDARQAAGVLNMGARDLKNFCRKLVLMFFIWKRRRTFFLVEYIKGISYSHKSHGGVVRHERRVGDKLVLPPGRCESR
jgi:hypothetical protein